VRGRLVAAYTVAALVLGLVGGVVFTLQLRAGLRASLDAALDALGGRTHGCRGPAIEDTFGACGARCGDGRARAVRVQRHAERVAGRGRDDLGGRAVRPRARSGEFL
jgi:hypothetical protein